MADLQLSLADKASCLVGEKIPATNLPNCDSLRMAVAKPAELLKLYADGKGPTQGQATLVTRAIEALGKRPEQLQSTGPYLSDPHRELVAKVYSKSTELQQPVVEALAKRDPNAILHRVDLYSGNRSTEKLVGQIASEQLGKLLPDKSKDHNSITGDLREIVAAAASNPQYFTTNAEARSSLNRAAMRGSFSSNEDVIANLHKFLPTSTDRASRLKQLAAVASEKEPRALSALNLTELTQSLGKDAAPFVVASALGSPQDFIEKIGNIYRSPKGNAASIIAPLKESNLPAIRQLGEYCEQHIKQLNNPSDPLAAKRA